MKFNCDKDQVQIVDSNTDVLRVIRNITKKGLQEDAFYVFDVQDVTKKYELWKEKLPRVIPYYAVKCNDHLFLLKILSSLGVGFDCASKGEIQKVLSLDVDPSRIIFANPAKPSSHIRYAANQGIEFTTFDNETELYKMKAQLPSAKLILRFKCDATISLTPLGMKFGCNSITEAPTLLRLARTLEMEVVGVSFHVGSGCGEPEAFRRAITEAHGLFELGRSMGFNMQVLDIGGGFPGNKGFSIDTIADIINEALEEYFPIDSNVNIIAEPGRYFAASAFTLATLVYSKRVVLDDVTCSPHNMYYINDGIYGSFNSLLYDHAVVEPLPLSETQTCDARPCSIWGPTCDSTDRIIESVVFPNLNVGDWIIFENMGAYTFSAACSFNGFPIPKVFSMLNESTMLQLKDGLQPLEEEFGFSDLSQSEINDYPMAKDWKENQQLHSIFPDYLNLKEGCPFI